MFSRGAIFCLQLPCPSAASSASLRTASSRCDGAQRIAI
jgi:hypothetical protein